MPKIYVAKKDFQRSDTKQNVSAGTVLEGSPEYLADLARVGLAGETAADSGPKETKETKEAAPTSTRKGGKK